MLGQCGPDRRERVHALGPRAGEHDRRPARVTAVGVPDSDTVDGPEAGFEGLLVGDHRWLLGCQSMNALSSRPGAVRIRGTLVAPPAPQPGTPRYRPRGAA